jgi:cytochrome c
MKLGAFWRRVLGCAKSGAVLLRLGGLAGLRDAAWADDAPRGQMIARANACMGCHAVDRKVVGPSFQQIAAKYKGDAQAPGEAGEQGEGRRARACGVIPMPAHPIDERCGYSGGGGLGACRGAVQVSFVVALAAWQNGKTLC